MLTGGLPDPLPMRRTVTTPKDAIDQVRKVGDTLRWGGRSYLRELAYQPANPLGTWWLVSTGEKPAYHRAKVAFTRATESLSVRDSGMFIGLNIEKGLAGKAIEYARGPGRSEKHKRWAMGDHWVWHSFLRALATEQFAADLNRAHTAAGGPPISVAVSVADVVIDAPSAHNDYDVPRGDRHEVQYIYRGERLTLAYDHQSSPHARLLTNADGIETLQALAACVEKVNNIDWKWVDVYIGFHFVPAVDGAVDTWGSSEIWERICWPWADWLWNR